MKILKIQSNAMFYRRVLIPGKSNLSYGKFGVLKMKRLEQKERTDYSDHSSHSPESVFRIYHVPLSAGYWRYSYPSVALTSP